MISYILIFICGVIFNFKISLCKNNLTGEKIFGKKWMCIPVLYMVTLLVINMYDDIIPSYFLQAIDMIASISVIAFLDYKKRIIPNIQILLFLFSQSVYAYFFTGCLQRINVVISIGVLLLLGLISFATKEQFGMGDVKLITAVNLIYGLPFVMYTSILSFLAIILYSLPFLIKRKFSLKTELPFGPFYLVGIILYFSFYIISA